MRPSVSSQTGSLQHSEQQWWDFSVHVRLTDVFFKEFMWSHHTGVRGQTGTFYTVYTAQQTG